MKVLHFADLHLGVENYGRINPQTGLSTRLEDFLDTLDHVVDYAIDTNIDLVLFCGDAYKSREPTQTQQREFARRISRLSTANIPIFLLIGNHDLPNAIGRATTTEIFDTLSIKNVFVSNRPDIYHIPTAHGAIQVASLPWLRRSTLLSKEDTKNLTFEQINQRLQEALTGVITSHIDKLDPSLPSILAAHVWVTGSELGSERMMTIGQEHTLLVSSVSQPAFDYIALGHIHKHQVLSENPPVIYAGSLERIDFNEESHDKGFYTVDIEPDGETGVRKVSYQFHPVQARRFFTIDVELEAQNIDPTTTVLNSVSEKAEEVRDSIVRLQLSLPTEVEAQLRDNDIRDALKEAYYFTIAKDIKRETRLRLGNLSAEEVSPLDALKAYLESKNTTAERTSTILEYGKKLIEEHQTSHD